MSLILQIDLKPCEARDLAQALSIVGNACAECALDDEWPALGTLEWFERRLGDAIRLHDGVGRDNAMTEPCRVEDASRS